MNLVKSIATHVVMALILGAFVLFLTYLAS